jgi:hypothetical protein
LCPLPISLLLTHQRIVETPEEGQERLMGGVCKILGEAGRPQTECRLREGASWIDNHTRYCEDSIWHYNNSPFS